MTMTTRKSDLPARPPSQAEAARGDAKAALRGKDYNEQVQLLTPRDDVPAPPGTGRGHAEAEPTSEPKVGNQPAGPTSQVDDQGWSSQYKTTDKHGKERLGGSTITYDPYKQLIDSRGDTKASSYVDKDRPEGAGHVLRGPVTMNQMLAIFDGVHSDLQHARVEHHVVENLLTECNTAFRVMLINTVEARAAYFANAYSESNQFRSLTETALGKDDHYKTKGRDVTLNKEWLEAAARGEFKSKNIGGYQSGGSIHAKDGAGWDEAFIGRGATQITHRDYYVEMIVIMEKRLSELPSDDPDRAQLREAIDAIKADPARAGDTRYGFLFSAAHQKMPLTADGKTVDQALSHGARPTVGMGPQDDKLGAKEKAFTRAKEQFMAQHEAEKSGGAAPAWLRGAVDEANAKG